MDELWASTLRGDVPTEATEATESLMRYIEERTKDVSGLPPEVDVVVEGCGFCALYFVGVHAVLSRARGCSLVRYAGASSGAMCPMELLCLGERRVLEIYMAMGLIHDRHPANPLSLAWRADAFWWRLSETIFSDESAREKVDDRVHARGSGVVGGFHPLAEGAPSRSQVRDAADVARTAERRLLQVSDSRFRQARLHVHGHARHAARGLLRDRRRRDERLPALRRRRANRRPPRCSP